MFKDTEQGETQYCSMCEDWARKFDEECLRTATLATENQALRRSLKDQNIVAIVEENERLRQENERLKAENEQLKFIIEKYRCANERLYNANVDNFNFTLTKYKHALEEIREITIHMANDIDDFETCYNDNEKILEKINEVLNERD